MRLLFYYTSSSDNFIISNASYSQCEMCISKCSSDNEKHKCDLFGEERRSAVIETENGTLYVCSGQAVKSSRIFKEKRGVVAEALDVIDEWRPNLREKIAQKSKRHVHNLEALNGQSIQNIYSTLGEKVFEIGDRDELLADLTQLIDDNTEDAAKLILDLLKNQQLEKTEFQAYRKLFEKDDMQIFPAPIHKVVLRALNTFWKEFNQRRVSVSIEDCHEKVEIDFDAVVSSFIYILDNARKYVCPDTELKIEFTSSENKVEVAFNMISYPIKKSEKEKIFDEGYSGKIPSMYNSDGDGVGLYIAERLVSMTGGNLSVETNVDSKSRTKYLGIEFEKNIFKVELPKANQ